jgi:hypothetical protein
VPSEEDLDFCLNALANAKAVGEDGIPIEAYRASESARADLFQLIRDIWREEDVPAQLTRGVFCPFFKNKGSSEDMSKYRFICLLNPCIQDAIGFGTTDDDKGDGEVSP